MGFRFGPTAAANGVQSSAGRGGELPFCGTATVFDRCGASVVHREKSPDGTYFGTIHPGIL